MGRRIPPIFALTISSSRDPHLLHRMIARPLLLDGGREGRSGGGGYGGRGGDFGGSKEGGRSGGFGSRSGPRSEDW